MKKTYKSLYKSHADFLRYCLEKSHLSHQYLKNIRQSGDDVEWEVREILKQIIPERFKVTHWYIVNAKNDTDEPSISPQCDVIIVDTLVPHRIFTIDYKNGSEIVPLESVVWILEIKRKLDHTSLKKAIEQIKRIKETVEIKKDNQEKYIPWGLKLGGALGGGYNNNPLLWILSIDAIKNFSKNEGFQKYIKNIQDAEIDLIGCFHSFLLATRSDENDSVKTFTVMRPKEVKYRIIIDLKTEKQEKVMAIILGFISAYIQDTCGRKADANNYFFNKNI